MQIYKPALDRIRAANLTGEGLAALFDALADRINHLGAVDGGFTMGYTGEDEVPADTLVPEIVVRLKRP